MIDKSTSKSPEAAESPSGDATKVGRSRDQRLKAAKAKLAYAVKVFLKSPEAGISVARESPKAMWKGSGISSKALREELERQGYGALLRPFIKRRSKAEIRAARRAEKKALQEARNAAVGEPAVAVTDDVADNTLRLRAVVDTLKSLNIVSANMNAEGGWVFEQTKIHTITL